LKSPFKTRGKSRSWDGDYGEINKKENNYFKLFILG
jgi:hypothetical protein